MKIKLAIKILIIVIVSLTGCKDRGENNSKHHKSIMEENDQHVHEVPDSAELTDYSIYNLQATWLTQNNEKIKLSDLRGTVCIIAIVYTSCDYVCPRIVADMKRIESKVPSDKRNKVDFVLVSIDPETDTPQKLKSFAAERKFDSKHWTLLHGNENDILELAALLSVNYKKVSGTDFAHSNIITVLNQQGEIAYQQNGIGVDPVGIMETIEKLTK